VTARTGAVIHDIETVSKRRDPGIRILLCPCAVQGEGAADEICRALEMLDKAGADVIIVGRGGGSMEDLWAFNEEKVAWAIFNCKTPVISAVGHETDTTIADLVADRRAATPSEAAEIAVSDMGRLMLDIRERQTKLTRLMRQKLGFQAQRAKYYGQRLQAVSPLNRLRSDRMHLEALDQRMQAAFRERNKEVRHRHSLLAERLRALSPQAKLDAGYAYVETDGQKPVRSVRDLSAGSRIRIRLRDGAAGAVVEELEADEKRQNS
jgi:exodeoxyribonuclease VII large subunit